MRNKYLVETTYTWATRPTENWPYPCSGSTTVKEVVINSTREDALAIHAKIVLAGLERTRYRLKDCTANPPDELVLSQSITEL